LLTKQRSCECHNDITPKLNTLRRMTRARAWCFVVQVLIAFLPVLHSELPTTMRLVSQLLSTFSDEEEITLCVYDLVSVHKKSLHGSWMVDGGEAPQVHLPSAVVKIAGKPMRELGIGKHMPSTALPNNHHFVTPILTSSSFCLFDILQS